VSERVRTAPVAQLVARLGSQRRKRVNTKAPPPKRARAGTIPVSRGCRRQPPAFPIVALTPGGEAKRSRGLRQPEARPRPCLRPSLLLCRQGAARRHRWSSSISTVSEISIGRSSTRALRRSTTRADRRLPDRLRERSPRLVGQREVRVCSRRSVSFNARHTSAPPRANRQRGRARCRLRAVLLPSRKRREKGGERLPDPTWAARLGRAACPDSQTAPPGARE